MRNRISRGIVAGVLAGAAGIAGGALPEAYDIELVARSGFTAFNLPNGASISSQPVSLDEAGGVALRFIGGAPGEGVYYGGAGGGMVIASGQSVDPVFSGSVDVANGRVAVADAFLGGGGMSIFSTGGAELARLAPGGPLAVSGISTPSIAADGTVCYEADFGFLGERIVVEPFGAAPREQVEVANDFGGEFSFLFRSRINDARSVVANTIPSFADRAIILFRPDPVTGAYGPAGREVVATVESGSTYSAFVNSTAIANGDRVAFSGRRRADGVWEVVRRDPSGQLTTIAEGGQLGIGNSSLANFPPAINSSGVVVFRADDVETGSTALYVGDGAELRRVIGAGETVQTDVGPLTTGFDFGGTTGVQTLNSAVDINDAGQLGFALFLENGTIGVFVATPREVGGCNAADLAEPFGELDITDVVAFLQAFGAGEAAADLASPQGVFDIVDVVAFLQVFGAGCP